MPLSFLDDPAPTLGMIRDEASWKLPAGAAYDLLNMLNDVQGVTRMRMGSTALVSGAQTAFATTLGFCYSNDTTPIEELYSINGKTGVLSSINKTTGALTANLGGPGTVALAGRSVRHFGFVVFPMTQTTNAEYNALIAAGQTTVSSFSNTVAATTTAGVPQFTLSGADTTTNVKVGGIVYMVDAAAGYYMGRVVSVDSATKFTVWPTPVVNMTTAGAGQLATNAQQFGIDSTTRFGGACAASFQNRLLYGGVNVPTATPITRFDRRVMYSVLPTETTPISATLSLAGATFLWARYWPALNYFDVPGSDPIVAMEPVSDNELLILTSTHPVIFRGVLSTQLATTSPTITFDLSDVNEPYGCLSDLSVQRTNAGIVFAGSGGIYAYQGAGRFKDLTRGLINSYWRTLTGNTTSFVIHGSAYVRGQYIISGAAGGTTFSLACDLNGSDPKWTRLSGVGTDVFYGIARPSNAAQVFAARWWDQTGAAPSFTNGQTLRLESMMAPYVSGTTTDADGTAITTSLTTRTITGDPELQKLFQRATVRHQQSSTTAAVTVTAQSKIDAADISAASVRTLGSLSNTSVLTLTAATNANPIACTTSTNHGLQTDDFVDIDGVTGNTNANGRWRIAVTGNTTFTLVGGIGNGAMGGSPTVKKLTETDYLASPLNAGQGVSFKFDGAPNNFELHGTRVAVLQRDSVSSA